MAAFNIGGKTFSTMQHGREHIQQTLNQHGIKVDYEDHPVPPGYIQKSDGTYIKISDAKIDSAGQVSGPAPDQYLIW